LITPPAVLSLLPACGEKVPEGRMRGALASRHMRAKASQRTRPLFDRLNTRDSARPSPAFGTLSPLRRERDLSAHLLGRTHTSAHALAQAVSLLLPACGEKVPEGRMRGAFASRHMRAKPSRRARTQTHCFKTRDSARPSPAFGTLSRRCGAREWMTDAS